MKKILIGIVSLLILASVIGVVMAADTAASTATVTVNTFLSVTLSNDPVTFPDMDPGTGPTAADSGILTATIGAESNVDAKVETIANSATFIDGTNTFAVSEMDWSPDNSAWTAYSDTTQGLVCASVSATGDCLIYHQLTIPSNQAAGTYSVGITITATGV